MVGSEMMPLPSSLFLQLGLGFGLIVDIILLLALVIIGIIIIIVIAKVLLFFLPAAIIAVVVWFLTRGSYFWAGVAFLAVAFLSILKRK
jgi:hypothetical protein